MKRSVCVLVAVAALMVFGACSTDEVTQPVVHDTTPPGPPVGVQIEAGDDLVYISWTANPEIDLAGYRLYRSSDEAGPFGKVDSDLLLCPWYFDQVIRMSMTYYRVTAVDESGNESAFSEVFGVYSNTGGRDEPELPVNE
jgi:hypothetical protein